MPAIFAVRVGPIQTQGHKVVQTTLAIHCCNGRSLAYLQHGGDIVVTLLLLFVWLGGVVVRALDLRLEIAGSIPAAALSSSTLDKLFTHIVQRL